MSADRCTLLIVDDEAYILPTLKALLRNDFDVITAPSADEAELILRSQPVHVLLTDQRMPRRTGIQLLEWTREHSPHTVRLLMTGYSELDEAVDAINRGQIYYYLLKPWRTQDLLQILRNAAEKYLLERKREQLLGELQEFNRELERRVADRTRQLEEANRLLQERSVELERLALTDVLTGLQNRRAMDDMARFEFKRHARYPGSLALGIIDVDHFKQVNSNFLLTGGDAALKGLVRILTASIREVDSVGRIGGEEFLVLAREADYEGTLILSERIRSAVAMTPIVHDGQVIPLTVSIGFAVAESGVPAAYDEMYTLAASALSEAKRRRNHSVVRCVHVKDSSIESA
jgi:diguanylate cyclase